MLPMLASYGVLESFGLGTLAQSSLLLAALLVCWVAVPTRIVGERLGEGNVFGGVEKAVAAGRATRT